jgi:hypothetical protein
VLIKQEVSFIGVLPTLGIGALFELFLCNAMEQKSECEKPDPKVKKRSEARASFLLLGNAQIFWMYYANYVYKISIISKCYCLIKLAIMV